MAPTPDPAVTEYIEASTTWPDEMIALRPILLEHGLQDSIKWNKPCFDYDGANIVIFQEMKDHLSLMFFKGALLEDPAGVLVEQGPNSRSAKRICFRSVDDVNNLAEVVGDYIDEAIANEEAGLQVDTSNDELVLVDELQHRLDADPELKTAFEGLTPGRQREYNLYFSGAKQAATRESRIDKYTDKILSGKGMRDR